MWGILGDLLSGCVADDCVSSMAWWRVCSDQRFTERLQTRPKDGTDFYRGVGVIQ
jgi:hypothetical protein